MSDEPKESAMEEGHAPAAKTNSEPPKRSSLKLGLLLLAIASIVFLGVGLKVWHFDDDDDEEIESFNNGTLGNDTWAPNPGGKANGNIPNFSNTTVQLPLLSARTLRQKYDSCDGLRVDLTEVASYIGKSTIERNVQWFYHQNYNYGGGSMRFDDAMTGALPPASPTSDKESIPTDESSYGTNNQVEGVDEADVVKSDGEFVYVAYGMDIVKLDADEVTELNRVSLPKDDSEPCGINSIGGMLLIGNSLVVVATGYCNYFYGPMPVDTVVRPGVPVTEGTMPPIIQGYGNTQVLIYDTDSLELEEQKELRGNYISARSIENNVHIVTSSWLDYYQPFTRFFEPYDTTLYPEGTKEEDYKTLATAMLINRTSTFVDQLITELDCDSMQKVTLLQNSKDVLPFGSVFEALNSVYSFDVTAFASTFKSTDMVLPSGVDNVFSSLDNLVLSASGWYTNVEDDGTTSTHEESYFVVYKLEGAKAIPQTLAKAPGSDLNQFSMGVYNGNLQVATTINARWGLDPSTNTFSQVSESFSQVSIFEIKDTDEEEAKMLGFVDNLGKGERIYAVRFMGDRGFVVTFRQIDPFYSLDLSDATKPQIKGELKIPGFSNYLHPIGTDYILGVGQDADEETGRQSGLKISLFDVSDLSNPVEAIKPYVETAGEGSSSEAQYDHKAFRYLEESQLLILPLSVYDYSRLEDESSDNFDGFRLYKIDPNAGITQYFDIAHASQDFYYGCYGYYSLQARSLVFEGDIMTMKGHSILSHDLTLREPDAPRIDLDENLSEDQCYPIYFPGPMRDCIAC